MSLKSFIRLAMQIFLADWSAFGNEKQSISQENGFRKQACNHLHYTHIAFIVCLLSALAFLKLLQNAFRI